MKQAAKAIALVLFLSLLSGCSSAETKACKLAVETKAEYFLKSETLFAQFLVEGGKGTVEATANSVELFEESQRLAKKANKVILNNPQCFTPKQVVEAE